VGSVVCRVVSCVPPWEWDPACTPVAATNDRTGAHTAPCVGTAPPRHVYAFGAADDLGEGRGRLGAPAVAMAMRPQGDGGWVVAASGALRVFGEARKQGAFGAGEPRHPIVDIVATPSGRGYWMVSARGRVWAFGDADHHGSVDVDLVKPIVAMARTTAGDGYWLVNSNGRVFAFGAAARQSGPTDLPSRVCGIAPTPTDAGYWLVARSGRVFAFGDARPLRAVRPDELAGGSVVGIAGAPDGRGYALLTDRGRVLRFGSMTHHGGLGSVTTPHGPAFAIVATTAGTGYWIGAQPA
jgi:hypothetical protein